MVAFQVIGKPIARADGVEKVTGAARYTADVALPGTLWGKVLHAPFPHARIVSIDTSAAEALPGVVAVITGEDTNGAYYGGGLKDLPVLARGRVRFAGERVAAVAAEDEDTAQRALDLIDVEYEELPAVFEIDEALADDAPILHPDFNTYPGVVPAGAEVRGPFAPPRALTKPSNLYYHTLFERGDVEQGFRESDLIVERTYRTQRVHQGYLEPQTVLVRVNPDGVIEAWTGSKIPYRLRASLAAVAGVPEDRVVLHHTFIGGDFGGKGTPGILPICYLLAKKTGRPVRMVNDYIEEFSAGNPRHSVSITMKTGVKRDGTIVAHQVRFMVNSGAYAAFKPFGFIFGPTQAGAPYYKAQHTRIESGHVYTNTVPGGFMRAPGEAQAFFALESHMDVIARELGMDPVEFRLRNLVESGEEAATGERLEAVRVKDALRAAIEAAGFYAPKRPGVGRGIALGERPPGGGEGNAAVTLRPDGRVTLGTPVFEQGSGTYTLLRQIVAEELGIAPERIDLEVWSTGAVESDSGVAGSWATRVNSGAAFEAAQAVKEELLRFAAERLQCSRDVLSLHGEEIWRRDIEERLSWPELLARSGEEVSARSHYVGMGRAHVTSFTAQVAEVEVDRETGEVKLLSLTAAFDTGRVLNPMGHQGQIYGGMMQGMGYALMEELRVEDGRVANVSFGDYKMPSMRDIPALKTLVLESETGVGPYQIRGIGEVPLAPVAPAIANAIADAVGVRLYELPLTAEKVYRALREGGSGASEAS